MAIIKLRVEAQNRRASNDEKMIAAAWTWEEITHPTLGGKALTRDEALEIIQRDGLILVHDLPGVGQIYDLPHEPFLEKHKGFFKKNRR